MCACERATGAAPSSYDWSRTHARRRGGEALNDYRPENGRAVHRDRSVRELAGGRRRRLRRRLNAWASIAVAEQDRSSASAYSTARAASTIAGERGRRRLEGT